MPLWKWTEGEGLPWPLTSALSVLLAPLFGAAIPNEYSRSPAALLSGAAPEMASLGVILRAHGAQWGRRAEPSSTGDPSARRGTEAFVARRRVSPCSGVVQGSILA